MVTGRKLHVFVSEGFCLGCAMRLRGTYSWTECVVAIVAGDADHAKWPAIAISSRHGRWRRGANVDVDGESQKK